MKPTNPETKGTKLAEAERKDLPICLIVEDEPAILRLIRFTLGEAGCVTVGVADAEGALEILKSNAVKPSITISDVRLPGMDGLELARRIKADPNLSEGPVILMSAYGEPREHLGDAFIAKPFDPDELAEVVGSYLADSA